MNIVGSVWAYLFLLILDPLGFKELMPFYVQFPLDKGCRVSLDGAGLRSFGGSDVFLEGKGYCVTDISCMFQALDCFEILRGCYWFLESLKCSSLDHPLPLFS